MFCRPQNNHQTWSLEVRMFFAGCRELTPAHSERRWPPWCAASAWTSHPPARAWADTSSFIAAMLLPAKQVWRNFSRRARARPRASQPRDRVSRARPSPRSSPSPRSNRPRPRSPEVGSCRSCPSRTPACDITTRSDQRCQAKRRFRCSSLRPRFGAQVPWHRPPNLMRRSQGS